MTTTRVRSETLDGVLRLRHPTQVAIAHDGSLLAFTMTEAARERDAADRTRVWLMRPNGDRALITSGPGSDRTPRFAPNDQLLGFTSDRHSLGSQQPFVLDIATGEERRIADIPGSIEDVRWDADSLTMVALVADPSADRAGSQGATRMGTPSDPAVMRPGAGGRRLVQIALDRPGTRDLPTPGLSVWEFDSVAGRWVVALASDEPSENAWYDASLVLLDLEASTSRSVFASSLQLSSPRLSADGQRVAVIEGLASDRGLVAGGIRLIDLQNAAASDPLGGLEDVTTIEWRDETSLWCVGRRGLECTLGVITTAGSYDELWSGAALLGNHFQPYVAVSQTGFIAAAYETVSSSPEIAIMRPDTARSWQTVSQLNQHVTDRIYRPEAERITWTAPDGLEIEGLLLRPPGRTGPLPLVVIAHGGPTWAWSYEFAPFEGRAPLLVEAGYAVLLPNPRGSTGRGHRFVAANVGDLGGADLQDILSGVEACIRTGAADADRVGLIGLSYGGFMTAWAVTQTHQFAAAVAMSCISDWISYHYTSNIARFDELFLTGDLHDPASHYHQRAPILHTQNCRTPTLVMHGELDLCTPVGQARELYAALVEAGVETELVIYPREGHWPTEYDHQADAWDRVQAWFARHLHPSSDITTPASWKR